MSDGVPAFKPPEWINARRTLLIMGCTLGTMFVGITVASHIIGLAPDDPTNPHYQVLLGKLAKVAFGAGSVGYFLVSFATLLVPVSITASCGLVWSAVKTQRSSFEIA